MVLQGGFFAKAVREAEHHSMIGEAPSGPGFGRGEEREGSIPLGGGNAYQPCCDTLLDMRKHPTDLRLGPSSLMKP